MNRRGFFGALAGLTVFGASKAEAKPYDANTCVQCGCVVREPVKPSSMRTEGNLCILSQPSTHACIIFNPAPDVNMALHDKYVEFNDVRTCYSCWFRQPNYARK